MVPAHGKALLPTPRALAAVVQAGRTAGGCRECRRAPLRRWRWLVVIPQAHAVAYSSSRRPECQRMAQEAAAIRESLDA